MENREETLQAYKTQLPPRQSVQGETGFSDRVCLTS